MKELDRNRPYSQVIGDDQGRHYHQDGVYFDHEGNEHGAPVRAPKPKAVAREVSTDDQDQVGKQIAE